MERKNILILAKTYPNPSAKYIETACVAGIDDKGKMVRIYPVPFRLMEEHQKFKKYQWIECLVDKARDDSRHESHKIYLGNNSPLITKHLEKWCDRMPILEKIPCFTNFQDLADAQKETGISLALLKPKQIEKLEITKECNPNWTHEELIKLQREYDQMELFSQTKTANDIPLLRKMPYKFHYHYTCETLDGNIEHNRHIIIDWEINALYWNVCQQQNWEQKIRQKYEQEFIQQRELWFLMGNMHRLRHQFMIISVIAIPKETEVQAATGSLFDF